MDKLKPWNGCKHKITRKLYFQKEKKWITTEYSICEECSAIIKKTKVDVEEKKDEV